MRYDIVYYYTNNMSFDDFKLDDEFDDFVSFTDTVKEKPKEIKKDEYDFETMQRYRVFRDRKLDPIGLFELNEEYAFKFPYKWDPYTGERTGVDPMGALWFDPDILIKLFHTKRLEKIWSQPQADYQGFYDDGVGAGETFYLSGRGYHPEWYVFRIPIIDCYLTTDHNKQIITFGPKLTDDEIKEIERLANLRPNNYKNMHGHHRPSLSEMKRLYDIAIAKTPDVKVSDKNANLAELYTIENKKAVDLLNKMRG